MRRPDSTRTNLSRQIAPLLKLTHFPSAHGTDEPASVDWSHPDHPVWTLSTNAKTKERQAHYLSLALILGLCPSDWNPHALLVKVWMMSEKNQAKRRRDTQHSTDASWFREQVLKDPWTVMKEALAAVSETMRLVRHAIDNDMNRLMRSTRQWLTSSESAKKTIHPWIRGLLIEAPSLEILALKGICGVAVIDLKDVTNQLAIIKESGDHNDYQMWVFIGRVLRFASQHGTSWLHTMKNQLLLTSLVDIPRHENEKIVLLLNHSDKFDISKEANSTNKAKVGE